MERETRLELATLSLEDLWVLFDPIALKPLKLKLSGLWSEFNNYAGCQQNTFPVRLSTSGNVHLSLNLSLIFSLQK